MLLETTDEHSIILADELCSGTEIPSALSMVSATLLCLDKLRAKYIFTTHYHELLDIDEIKALTSIQVFHMKVTIHQGKIIFNRTLEKGKCEDNYGVEIAQHMKMPSEFIHMATKIRNKIKSTSEIISTKVSRYNKEIYMTECKICKSNKDLHTHHIIYQNVNKGEGKNYKNNLIVLCEECHIKLHKNEIEIKCILETTEGLKID